MGRIVIFLDLDGVLITRDSRARAEQRGNREWAQQQAQFFSPECVRRLNDLLASRPETEIALVSELRRMKHVRSVLQRAGVIARWVSIDVPILHPHGHRGDEVGAWLAARRHGIDAYVVLDDQPDLYARNEEVRRHLVVCHPEQGLTTAAVKSALGILAGATVDVDDPVEA